MSAINAQLCSATWPQPEEASHMQKSTTVAGISRFLSSRLLMSGAWVGKVQIPSDTIPHYTTQHYTILYSTILGLGLGRGRDHYTILGRVEAGARRCLVFWDLELRKKEFVHRLQILHYPLATARLLAGTAWVFGLMPAQES